ncbi:MAG: hypothetical protein IKQ62_05980 [Bacteroidaceae bacterium]|nr:hypothetical protein [Bacteroidaceae bacterium]
MAARVTTFNADGVKEREVLYVRYELHQDTDPEGQTAGPVRGGKIYVKVKSHDDGNTDLLEWMCSESDRKDGTITYPNHQGGEMKHLDFKEGYMVDYKEVYDSTDPTLQYEEFTLSPKQIILGNADHDNRWTIY